MKSIVWINSGNHTHLLHIYSDPIVYNSFDAIRAGIRSDIFTLILVLIMYSSIIIAFNLIMSSINKQSIISFKIWQKFHLKNENLLKSNIKIKVKIYFLKTKIQIKLAINFSFIKILNAMERLSSRNYPVCFSCADQFIVTRRKRSQIKSEFKNNY